LKKKPVSVSTEDKSVGIWLQSVFSFLNPVNNKLPLRIKITIPYFFLAVLIAISAAFLVSNIIFHTVEERFNNQLGEVGKLSSELMVVEEDNLLETLRLITYSENVVFHISQHHPEDLRNAALGIAINQQADAIEFLDKDGYLVFSMRHKEGSTIEDYAYTTGGDNSTFTNLEFVNKVLKAKEDHLGDKYSGYVEADWGNYFYVSGPVYDEANQFQGVIMVGTRLDKIVIRMHEKVLAQVTLYTDTGEVLSSSFPYNPEPLEQNLPQSIFASQDEAKSKVRNFEEKRGFSISNLGYFEILGPWEVRGDRDMGILGASLRENFIVKQSPATRLQITSVIALALFLVIMIGLNLAKTITRPLTKLVTASQTVANGNLDVQVEADSNDEIAILADSFNTMIASLKESRSNILDAYDRSLEGWSKALELRDKETEGHTQRGAELSVELAKRLGIQGDELVHIKRGAIIHDLGKMAIPDSILHKPGPLNDEEWAIMKQHPVYAYEMLKDIKFLQPALDIPYYHHEHWNGGGYPKGLAGKDIPLSARIFAVVDSWDALTNDRSYRKKLSCKDSLRILENNAGIIYDPEIVQIFKDYFEDTNLACEG
jgi:HD-GYP domain-containing protein (c-di-GMP phosphodiesterase class II)